MPSSELQELEIAIQGLETQRSVLGDAVVDAALAPLQSRRATLRGEPTRHSGQALKHVSIVFVDVVGSTSLAQHLDAEEVSAVMDGALSRGTALVEAHRGKVLQYAGDNILAAFGVDRGAEDDAEQAVRCGLALLELGKALREEVEAAHGHAGFDLRVGIHSGGVLLGGGVDADGTIRGIAVHIAARMEQTAPPGGLRISHDTYAQVRGVFDVEPQPPLSIKGVDAPVRSYLVVRARPRAFRVATRGIEGVETRMIGREAELQALQDAFLRVIAPGAGLQRVLVVADAGVGKSRLLYEFDNWMDPRPERVCIFRARATPQSAAQPYSMLRDLFAWRFQILDADSLPQAQRKLEAALMPLFAADHGEHEAQAHVHLLGQLIGLDYGQSPHIANIRDDARQIRMRGFNAAAEALRRISVQAGLPVVIELDDLHWADEASLDFIDHLEKVDRDVPMLLLTLTRPTLFERRKSRDDLTRVNLAPLDRQASRDLTDELLKKLPLIPAALRELVTGRADGNPFYMEELVKMLIDQGAIRADDEWSVDAAKLISLQVPPTLTGVLQARLDGLPPSERGALQLASVIGLRFWDAALAHVAPQAAAELPALRARKLVDLSDAALAGADGAHEYAFCHQILHQVTYDTVLRHVKRLAHGRAADWLAHRSGALGTGLFGEAAQHYERAGDNVNAAQFYARAAEHQAAVFAHEAALEYTARALQLAPDDLELRWRLLSKRERVLDMLGRREAQLTDIDAMQALADALPPDADGDRRRADVAWRRADIADRTGDYPTAEREARRAHTIAEQAGDEVIALRAIKRLVQALAYQGDPATGKAIAEAALVRARAFGSPAQESGLLNALTVCTDMLGDRVAGLHNSLLDLALNREAGDRLFEAVAQSNVGMSYLSFGSFEKAREHLRHALELHRALGNRSIEGNTHGVLSELAWREGDAPLALSEAQAAFAIATEVESRLHQCDSLWSIGNAELGHGRLGSADEAFKRSEALAREIAHAPLVLNALDGQARVALSGGDMARARALAERLIDEGLLEASRSEAADPLAGTYEHLIRLTLHLVWTGVGDAARADDWLVRAYAALEAEVDRIGEADLRQTFLTGIAEHREIVCAMERKSRRSCRPRVGE